MQPQETEPTTPAASRAKPVGEALAWEAAAPPRPIVLQGNVVRLEPIDVPRHVSALHEAASADPGIWTYMSNGPFRDEDELRAWLQGAAASSDPLFFVVVDEASGQAEGMASYLRMAPAHGVIEIGYIWFSPRLQRTRAATEAIFLLLRHAFNDLGYRRVEWKCDALNTASRRAAQRFGFQYEGVFQQHMVIKGRNRDTAWYAMLDHGWPAAQSAFQAWLSPENFDVSGKQRAALAALRAAGAETG